MPFLELQDVKTHFTLRKGMLAGKTIHTVKAVDGINLTIDHGEILGLVGESGCGKSTLSRTIMQLIPATSGSVILEGQNLSTLRHREVRAKRLDFQMIFQDPYASLNPRMTVFSTLAEAINSRTNPDVTMLLTRIPDNSRKRMLPMMPTVSSKP